jgi:hypothetical protein
MKSEQAVLPNHCLEEEEDDDGGQWRAPVNTVINPLVPERAGHFLSIWVTISFLRWIVLHGASWLGS